MRRRFLALALVLSGTTAQAWQPCAWNGEKAWQETSGPWLAIVSSERERLVYLGPARDPQLNLLFSPLDRTKGDWGGHRFWLGPQKEWSVFWPPLSEWEAKAAKSVEVNGDELILTEPHDDPALPALKRIYAWKSGGLVLTAEWSGGNRDWQGIHILQIPGTATARVRAPVSRDLPNGYALLPLADRSAIETNFNESPCVTREKDLLTIRRQGTEDKIGVAAGEITVREGAYGLRISPATYTGTVTGPTEDATVPTQIYAGTDAYPFLEVEQLTPRLRAPASARVVIEPFAAP